MPHRNTYVALRHGISLANEQGIILSHPENAVGGWGLSPFGESHCRELLNPERLVDLRLDPARTLVISSDFARALETARIFCELNQLTAPQIDARLRERFFGDLEHQPQDNYLPIWERDADDPTHHTSGCESTDDVANRLRALLAELESAHADRQIVLVSHGDPLQILETIFLGLPSNHHRRLAHLGNAELRILTGEDRAKQR
jgi:probable phosphoglycerate mutase